MQRDAFVLRELLGRATQGGTNWLHIITIYNRIIEALIDRQVSQGVLHGQRRDCPCHMIVRMFTRWLEDMETQIMEGMAARALDLLCFTEGAVDVTQCYMLRLRAKYSWAETLLTCLFKEWRKFEDPAIFSSDVEDMAQELGDLFMPVGFKLTQDVEDMSEALGRLFASEEGTTSTSAVDDLAIAFESLFLHDG